MYGRAGRGRHRATEKLERRGGGGGDREGKLEVEGRKQRSRKKKDVCM